MKLCLSQDIIITSNENQNLIYSIEEEKILKLNNSANTILGFFDENQEITVERALELAQEKFENSNSEEITQYINKLVELNILVKTE